jgi:hypothetical protein
LHCIIRCGKSYLSKASIQWKLMAAYCWGLWKTVGFTSLYWDNWWETHRYQFIYLLYQNAYISVVSELSWRHDSFICGSDGEESVQTVQNVQEKSNQFDLFLRGFERFKVFKTFKTFKGFIMEVYSLDHHLWTLWTLWTFWTPILNVLNVLNPSEYQP